MKQEYKDPKDLRAIPKERLSFEGNQTGFQFTEWRNLFDLTIACKTHELPEVSKWSVLSNRFLLMDREHLTDYKLFTKEEVLKMLQEAYAQGWDDRRYSENEDMDRIESEKSFMNKMSTI